MKEESEPFSNRKGLKIAVFGAGGAVGSILTNFLQQLEDVSQVICLDSNFERTSRFLKNKEKIIHIFTNGDSSEKLIRALKNCFLVINAASSLLNKRIMKIAWELGANYLDFASFKNDEAEQKNFHTGFKKKNIAAWINWGVGPGLTNLLVAKLIYGLEKCKVKIRVAESTNYAKQSNNQEPLIFLWNPQLVIDEITSPVYSLSKDPKRGAIVREPFSGPESCVFPYPIGKITCRHINQNELLTLKYQSNILEADVKTGGNDIERLYEKSSKIKKCQEKNQLSKFFTKHKVPSPEKITELINSGILLDGRVAILVEVEGKNPEIKERITQKATWMGLGLREVPQGTTHINFNTALVAICAVQQMINSNEIQPGVWAPEEISQTDSEIILECVQKKTNPVHYQNF